MRESLHAIVAGRQMGTLDYQQDRLTFRYEESWVEADTSFPLSLSMPLASKQHAQSRRSGDRGQFSLAGAQAKTGLYQDPKTRQWGIPHGLTPTTHILKPDIGTYDAYDQNEHFCLRLASKLGLPTTRSSIGMIGEIPVIIVERFDRIANADGKVIRVHQEDACQSSGKPPSKKYQSDGGPTARDVFDLILDNSSSPDEDKLSFLDAMIYNYFETV